MSDEIDYSNLADFPKRVSEKLKAIREHSKFSPDEFAPLVKAQDGAEILSYEFDTGELPVSILIRYARLANLPLENLVDDDRDLWFGHRVKLSKGYNDGRETLPKERMGQEGRRR